MKYNYPVLEALFYYGIYVLFMIPAMLVGFDVLPQSVEEMNLNRRQKNAMAHHTDTGRNPPVYPASPWQ